MEFKLSGNIQEECFKETQTEEDCKTIEIEKQKINKQFAFHCNSCNNDKIVKSSLNAEFCRPPAVCSSCGSINSFVSIDINDAIIPQPKQQKYNNNQQSYIDRINSRNRNRETTEIVDPKTHKRKELKRSSTGVEALDHITGGGLSEAFVLMIAGPPGCGKSTIATDAISNIQKNGMHYGPGGAYGSSEEDADAILETADRIAESNFKIVREKNIRKLISALDSTNTSTWVIDSLMECYDETIESVPGSPSQTNSVISIIYDRAHAEGAYKDYPKRTIIVIAHGTKSGDMAGPLKAIHGVDGAAIMEHVDPNAEEEGKRLPWDPVENQTKPTGYVSIRVFRKMRKTSNSRVAYMQMEKEFLEDGVTKNPIGGKLYMVDGPEWESNTIKDNKING